MIAATNCSCSTVVPPPPCALCAEGTNNFGWIIQHGPAVTNKSFVQLVSQSVISAMNHTLCIDPDVIGERIDIFQLPGAGPHKHGLSSNKMALITSDCGATRSPSIKWP